MALQVVQKPSNMPTLNGVVSKPSGLPTSLNMGQTPTQPGLQVAPLAPQGQITSVGTLGNQQPFTPRLTLREFGKTIKAKYPEYEDQDDEELAKAVLAKYPQYADKVQQESALPPLDTTGDRNKGFFGRVSDDIKKRLGNLGESYRLQAEGKQSMSETQLQGLGQVAGGVGDVIGEGLTSLYRAAAPQGVKDVVDSAGQAIGNSQAVQGAIGAYQGFKEAHPVAAKNVEAVANIGSLLPIGRAGKVATGVTKVTAPVAQTLAPRLATRTLNEVVEAISPVLTKGEKEAAAQAGRASTKGILRTTVLLPSPQDLEVAKSVMGVIKPKASTADNITAVRTAIAGESEELAKGLADFKGIVSPSQFKGALQGIEKPLMVAADSTLDNAYNRVMAKAMELVGKKPGTVSGLWEARVDFDAFIKKQFPNLFDDTRMTPINTAVTDIRIAWNDYIASRLPEGNKYKAQLKQLNNMYRARNQLGTKVIGELGANRFTKLAAHFRQHPIISLAAGAGVGVAGSTILGILANPVSLAALAAGGTIFYAGKAITKGTVVDMLTKALQTISDPTQKAAVQTVIRSLEQQAIKGTLQVNTPNNNE